MKRYLIIADDLTGANDTGVQLTRRGIQTVVTLDSSSISRDCDSYVLDCESRGLDASHAYNTVSEHLKKIDLLGFDYVIKKVDSTLRGNVAEEIKAVDEALGSELVIFMPALPDLFRTTEHGIHMLNGTRITQTEIAKDPQKPVRCDNLAELLSHAYHESIGIIDINHIRQGSLNFDEHRIYVADSLTNADMAAVVRAAMKTNRRTLWVGSSAIADSLLETEIKTLPALAVVASVSDVTRGQIKYAEEKGVRLVNVAAHELLENKNGQKYIDTALHHLQAGEDVILLSSASYHRGELDVSAMVGAKLGLSMGEMGQFVQKAIGEIASGILDQAKVSGVFLTGGDTAIGFLKQLGAQGCKIDGEVMLGIPSMTIIGGSAQGLRVITKAGAFGGPDAIFYALRKLKETR